MLRAVSLRSTLRLGVAFAAILAVAACSGRKVEYNYPVEVPGSDGRYAPSDQIAKGGLFGEDGLFGGSSKRGDEGGGIGVNALLWRASLETISFMPIVSADPFGGVIITDWYEDPAARGERFKINAVILDRALRADSIRVTLFKQKSIPGGWQDIAVPEATSRQLEDAILTRARQLRITQLGF